MPKFNLGDHARKISGSKWQGRIVGTYSTALTPEGYAVESDTETGSVQIYPAAALELVERQTDAALSIEDVQRARDDAAFVFGAEHDMEAVDYMCEALKARARLTLARP